MPLYPPESIGDVVGPASSTDNAIARYDSTTGKLIQDSGVFVSDVSASNVTISATDNITIQGGSTSDDSLILQADTATLGTYGATGTIRFKNLMNFNEDFTIEENNAFFRLFDFRLFRTQGNWTVENPGNVGQVAVVSADHTMKYSSAQSFTASATFQNQSIIQPTAGITDSTDSEWRGFHSNIQYIADLSTAVTATSNAKGYSSLLTTGVKAGSHASSAVVISRFIHFGAGYAIGAQSTVTNGYGVRISDGAGAGTLVNQYGIKVDDMTKGSTLNYAIQTGKGTHSFGDNTASTTIGFYGSTPIAQAVLATGAGATVDNVITALQNLGLVKQS